LARRRPALHLLLSSTMPSSASPPIHHLPTVRHFPTVDHVDLVAARRFKGPLPTPVHAVVWRSKGHRCSSSGCAVAMMRGRSCSGCAWRRRCEGDRAPAVRGGDDAREL
jgi:hypothetical protein